MGHTCWVRGCRNRSEDEAKWSFFTIPKIREHEGEQTKKISEERRRKWLANINRKADPTKYSKICSAHFVTGKPADLFDRSHPDWAPTIKMDVMTPKRSSKKVHKMETDLKRFDRAKEREKTKVKHSVARALLELQETPPAPPEPQDEPSTETTPPSCQFSMLGSLESVKETHNSENPIPSVTSSQVDSELQRMITENIELKEKASNLKFTEESFQGKDDKVKYYTGLPGFLTLMALYNFVEKYIPAGKGNSPLTKFEKLVLVLMRLRLNLAIQDLAYRYNISTSSVSRIFLSIIHVLYVRLKPLIHWPSREELQCTMPNEFRQYFGRKVAMIIDCFEIFIERPSNLAARAHTWSNYKHHNTVKFLIGITPQGSVSYISSAWGGRTSDKYITEHCDFLSKLLPGDLVLADRGFDIAESVGLVGAEVKVPSFMRGKSQLSPLDLEHTRKIAHVRKHVERVIGLVRNKYTILQDTLPIDFLVSDDGDVPVIDKVVTVACALVNMCDSVVSFD